jgi:O-antigen ligase
VTFRSHPDPDLQPPSDHHGTYPYDVDRWAKRRIYGVWSLLFLNTLPWAGDPGRSPIVLPTVIEQLGTAIMVLVALYLAITLNARLRLRPYPYFVIYTFLVLISFVGSLTLDAGLGGPARAARLAVWVFTLWLLSPYWPDPGRVCFRAHQFALKALLILVVIELPIFGSTAYTNEGRLGGVFPVLTPPSVGQYAALIIGFSVLHLIFGRRTRRERRHLWMWLIACIVLMLLSHTRTATVALLVSLGVALLVHALANRRARRILVVAALIMPLVVFAFGSATSDWFRRGQTEEELANLTGRASVWELLLNAERGTVTRFFGTGLSDKTFNGLPIDSGWLSVYQESGLLGVACVIALFIWLLMRALMRPADLARALSIFLTVFCLTSSYTDVGVGDASPTMLHLAAAASLAVAAVAPKSERDSRAARRWPRPLEPIRSQPLNNGNELL